MKTKKIHMVLAILIAFSFVTNQTYNVSAMSLGLFYYSDDIIPNSSFTWNVKTLDIVGDMYETSTDFYIGDLAINQGDTITLNVLVDPDLTNGTWFEMLLNGNSVPNSEYWGLGYLWQDYLYYGYTYGEQTPLISPVKYVNDTDSYNIYNLIWEEVQEYYPYEDTDIWTSTYPSSNITDEETVSIGFDLTGDIFTYSLYVNFQTTVDYGGGTYDIDKLEATIYTKINKETGLLEESYSFVNWDFKEYVNSTLLTNEVGHDNFWLQLSKGRALPHDWLFSLLGLGLFAVIFIIRKKR